MKEEQERTPLRTILQNFLNHIESLEIQRVEDSYEKEFQELKFFSEVLKTSKQYSCSEGEKEVNRKKNRYKDILPFDSSRVILSEYAGVPGSDYINANYIKGASGSPAYIACQGPLPHTVNDFWRMVVECEVQVIVMACNEEEAGKHKCENYWVEREGEEKQFGMVSIRLVKASTVCPDFLVRTMRLKYTSSQSPHEDRTICQFHYSAWPDHGVPPLVRPLLDMVRLVRDTQASETLPVLVHCSAGCGRTGTICAIDYVWGLLRAGKLNKDFSLYRLVQDMRKQRIAMVQTKEQYVLVHQAVRELFREQLRMIDSHPYENIDANGMPLVKEEQEPMYATPTVAVSAEYCSEEKQDGKEKEFEERIPPLPQKKRGHVACSKQEKEVENLTEKQRSIVEQLGTSMSHKPRIAKLRALFERSLATRESRSSQSKHRNCQLVARSHSLGAMRVKTENQEDHVVLKAERHKEGNINGPVFCHRILNAPQLSTAQGSTLTVRPSLPVKRSKSLKVLSSNQHYKLSLAAAVSPITSLNTADDRVSAEAGVTSVKLPADRTLLSRGESASNSKPFVSPKKHLTTRSGEVNVSDPDTDNCRSSKQDNKQFVSHKQLDWRNYEGNHVVPRRRRSLESVNFEDAAVSSGSGLDHHDHVLHPSHQLQLVDSDASKVLQDCKDYLISNMKCDVLSDQPGKKVQNGEAADNLTLEAQRKVNAIVAGLGVRERRNSFRQAVGTSREEMRSCRKLRDYEAIWPTGNSVATSLNGNIVQTQSFPSGLYGNVISENNSAAGSDLVRSQLQETKGKLGDWLHARHLQDPRDDQLQQPNERKFSSHSSELIKNRVSRVKGPPREVSASEQSTNAYVKVDNSNIGLGKLSIQPKHLIRSKVLTPYRRGLHHSQMGTDLGFGANKSASSGFSLSVDASSIVQSLSQCKLKVQGQKSTALGPRKPKNTHNSRSADFITYPNQESSLQTAADQELKTSSCSGTAAVTGKTSVKGVSYSSPGIHCHRNATGLVVSHGQILRVGSAVQNQCKSVPVVGDATSRSAEVNSSSHTAIPFMKPKKQHSMQEISYGLVAGVQLRRGSRDDLALCPSASGTMGPGPNTSSRVRRHASVVLLRRSLAETGGVSQVNSSLSQPSLAVWNSPLDGNGEMFNVQNTHIHHQEGTDASSSGSWLQAPGVDVDTVAASINPRHGHHATSNMTRSPDSHHVHKSPSHVSSVAVLPSSSSSSPSTNGFLNQQLPSQPATVVKKQHYF